MDRQAHSLIMFIPFCHTSTASPDGLGLWISILVHWVNIFQILAPMGLFWEFCGSQDPSVYKIFCINDKQYLLS